jgi:hypothetical protein
MSESINKLKPAKYNPRRITDKKLEILEKTLKEYGDLSGIVFNKKTGNLVGGHQRLKVLPKDSIIISEPFKDNTGTTAKGIIKTDIGEFTYREVNWTIEKEKAANIAANKGGGEWDFTGLKEVLFELDSKDFDFELTGFEFEEVEMLLNDSHLDDKASDEDIIEKEKQPSICPKCGYTKE